MARTLLRGDVVWADLDPVVGHEQAGRRPVVIISHPEFHGPAQTVVALAVTSKEPRAGYPVVMPLPEGCAPKKSWVKIGQVRALSTSRLGEVIGRVPKGGVDAMVGALGQVIG